MEKFGSGMEKTRIRDKHPGSAKLDKTLGMNDEASATTIEKSPDAT
jgi:hypothetical protein